jgi:hypothetical protein
MDHPTTIWKERVVLTGSRTAAQWWLNAGLILGINSAAIPGCLPDGRIKNPVVKLVNKPKT